MTERPAGGRGRKPTVREVAQLAGVSPMTVSRTLAGGTNVRPELQDRVLSAADALGYHRNENARSLRPGHSSGLIGVAITNLGNPYYGNFALGIEEVAASHGRRILLANSGEDPARERQVIRDFIGRQVEGIILVPASQKRSHLLDGALDGVPLVQASRLVDGLQSDSVVLDDAGGARRGTDELIRAGHERIAYLGNITSVFTGARRFEGYRQALQAAGLPVLPELVKRGQQDAETAFAATTELLTLREPPTAIFSANNRNTIGALRAISRHAREGRNFPSLAAFDDFELSELAPMPVTVVSHDPHRMGREAARLLFDRLLDRAGADYLALEMPTTLRTTHPSWRGDAPVT